MCFRSVLPFVMGVLVTLTACDVDKSPSPEKPGSAATGGASTGDQAPAAPTASPTAAPKSTAKPKLTGPSEPLNVMLITIDALRHDMPWTIYDRKIAPNITELAKRSTVYPRAYAASSTSPKALGTILTSKFPSSLYRSGTFFTKYAKSNLFFTEVLQEKGIRTMAGHGHKYFDRGKQLDQGFDIWKLVDGLKWDSTTDNNITSEKMTDLAIEMLSDPENTKQFFLWFHYMDPHDKYIQHDSTPVWGKYNRDRYDSEVHFTDQHIGRLFEFGKKQPWWDNTAIIISADHGEAFGEHGMYKHAFELWEVLTRVPLIIHAPGAKAQVIDQRRSNIDMAPTILDLMGIKDMPESFDGRSLVSEVYGATEPDNREPIVLDLPEDTNNADKHAIIAGDYKLIVYGRPGMSFALYNLKEDPGELKNISKKEPEKLEEMKQLYKDTWAKYPIIKPYGGNTLRSGKKATGPIGPPKK